MAVIKFAITNCGDGSNSLDWFTDPAVEEKMEALVEEGDERYASGDGLQVRTLRFPDGFDLEAWLKMNHISLTTVAEFDQ